MKTLVCATIAALLLAACRPPATARSPAPEPGTDFAGPLGEIALESSCVNSAAAAVERGLALLHHMTYEPADAAFAEAIRRDPACALARWGRAMSFIHPLWSDPPSAAQFAAGSTFVAQARRNAGLRPRDRAMIEAAGAYYDAGRHESEHENLAAFASGWRRAHEQFPGEPEITALFALALLGTADPADQQLVRQRTAGAMMEALLASHPNHPGAHHYLIHAYDTPPLAEAALSTARHYGNVAPAVPHALHMPTHIFTRLGLWEESISWNRRSATAARAQPIEGAVSLHYLHALDYLAYAYLQLGQIENARAVADSINGLDAPLMVEIATPYTLGAVPARLALEGGRWREAADLRARESRSYPWEKFPAVEALTHFARALGAAHVGDSALVRRMIARLDTLEAAARLTSPYWANQVHIQATTARAWQAWAQHDTGSAIAAMRAAAAREESTQKHPVTPGPLLPASELLADMLLGYSQPLKALEQYEATLARSPGRLRSLHGAARAAEQAGNIASAARYYGRLAELLATADAGHPVAEQARTWVKAHSPGG